MTTEQELREALPEGLPIDLQGELIEGLLGDSGLPIDTGLEVIVTQVAGDEFTASHPHLVSDDCLVLHLTPEDAREFDNQLGDFMAGMIVGAMADFDGSIDFEDLDFSHLDSDPDFDDFDMGMNL